MINMNRIDIEFKRVNEENKKALVPFVTFDNLSKEELAKLVVKIGKVGADLIEIGVPFSEPLADGVVIQEAYSNALKNNINIFDVLDSIKLIRKESSIPIILMLYYNLIYCFGINEFLSKAKEAGIDGLIIPDLPLEERGEFLSLCEEYNIYLIPLVAPTSKERIKSIIDKGKGFVYCISSMGVTGERSKLLNDEIIDYLNYVKKYSNKPFLIGFGISSAESAREVAKYSDGVIIGSAVVKRIKDNTVIDFIKDIRLALNNMDKK